MRVTALVLDDDPVLASLTSEALEERGYHVIPCLRSSAALNAFTRGAVDVALIDLDAPGLGTSREMIKKGIKLQKDCVFIVMGNYLSVDDYISLQTMGVYDCFHKPATLGTIMRAISRAKSHGNGKPVAQRGASSDYKENSNYQHPSGRYSDGAYSGD